jgi:hypothetical protein
MNIAQLLARLRRTIYPPRIVAVTRRPAGWFAVNSRGLRDVIAWARYDNGQVVGLVPGRRGLRPATGRHFHGYLPAAPCNSSDIQLSPPAVAMPVADLVEAIGDAANPWTSDAQAAIYDRLKQAARDEWASSAFVAFVANPQRFLERHFELIVEHNRPASLDAAWSAGLASITEPPAHAGIQEENRP